ncbi:MAG: CHRD domain-containing protein [Mariniblastus sp.]|nr:CHRD domain-containing protein [Mariniblastus sp.]
MLVQKLIFKAFLLASLLTFGPTFSATSQADIVELYATGAGGDGLLGTNIDPPSTNPGSGGLGPLGITLDTETNILVVHLLWGQENGYETLSGDVTMLHLHGPTESRAPDNFGEVNSNIIINLGNSLNFNPSASSGGLQDSFFVSNEEKAWVLSGRTYINVHTELNPTGEIRGYLIQSVPEPATGLVWMLIAGYGLALRRRR